jgi:hypothetical protein
MKSWNEMNRGIRIVTEEVLQLVLELTEEYL